MKKRYKIYCEALILAMVCATFTSCEKLIEVEPPNEKILSSEVFNDDATATSAMLGLYAQLGTLNSSIGNTGAALYSGMSSDELYRNTSVNDYDEFRYNKLSVSNSLLSNFIWTPAYKYIYQANSIINGISDNTKISLTVKNQLTGEAKFVRSYAYFHLINLFGAVPLVLTTDYQTTATLPRSDIDKVYDQIIADLTDAQALLGTSYVSAGKVRVNKWAATALLARIYLYKKNWSKAEELSSQVINSGSYSLLTDLNKVFLANSTEAIFQLLPVNPISASTTNTWDGFIFIPTATGVPTYSLTTYLLNSFTATDKRKSSWIKSTVVNNVTYYYPYKYQVKTGASITEHYMFLRLAEQYLIRAEAEANQGKLSAAIADLDMIRSRAGIPLLSNTNPLIGQSDLLSEIYNERQRELFMEGGHRWYDLKRTARADAVLGQIKPNWQSGFSLYPIPDGEIRLNPYLVQNPGY